MQTMESDPAVDQLNDYAKSVTSQYGEDGMIHEIFRRLPGDDSARWCVEFGAWDGKHLSNSWSLWNQLGWHAVLIEGEKSRLDALARSTAEMPTVETILAYVANAGPNSLDSLLKSSEIPADFDVLSIDIDGDDYWIWEGLNEYSPKVVVIEYNESFPASLSFVQEPGDYCGSSARAIYDLGLNKGYSLVALTRANLIFIRNDLVATTNLAARELDEVFDGSAVPVVYSDFAGKHHFTQVGPWGFTGVETKQGRLKTAYQAAGRKTYRKLNGFPALQRIISRRVTPESYGGL